MRHFLAGILLALIAALGAASPAAAAAVRLDARDEQDARSIIRDLDYYLGKFRIFAEGATDPLFYGRSLPVPAEACAAAGEPRRFGLLVGASDPGPQELRVAAALNDVRLLTSVLASVGAAPEDIHVLTGDRATRQGVVEAAWEILSQLGCGDKVFFYFGGYALMREDIRREVTNVAEIVAVSIAATGKDGHRPARHSGRSLDQAMQRARQFLTRPAARAELAVPALSIRRTLDVLDWYQRVGLTMLLNGQGTLRTGTELPLESFEVLTSSDLSELVTLFRNHRADVTVVLDTNNASDAALLEEQQAVTSDFWSAEVRPQSEQDAAAFDSRIRATRLVRNPGELAVLYSSVDKGVSVSTRFEIGSERIEYGLFTFRVAEAMLNGRNATVQNVRDALERIVNADPGQMSQPHRIEATRPDMPVFGRGEIGRQRTDTIRILQPSGMRGATTLETPQVDLVGVVDWRAPARAVLVEGQPATLAGDGRFSASVRLSSGLNTISVMALTSDQEIHVMPPLEIMFDGDLKKLKGEGRRFAVIIANQNYLPETRFSRLQTPIADAEALRDILTARYGFASELPLGSGGALPLFLVDATKDQINETLYTMGEMTTEQDTVLIYYAGHGVYDERTTNAYWVPVDATRPYNYLSGDGITEHIQRLAARSVILISDSCYSGALRAGGEAPPPIGGVTEEDRQRALLRMAEGRSRVLITSGGTEPVMDTGGGGHSIFARALLTGLEQMDGDAFSAEELFRDYIRPMVSGRAEQMPQFKPIDKTGHEASSDVVFVRLGDVKPAELR